MKQLHFGAFMEIDGQMCREILDEDGNIVAFAPCAEDGSWTT